MQINRLNMKGCCGKVSALFELDKPVTFDWADYLRPYGFNTSPNHKISGILYTESTTTIVSGLIGSNKLQVFSKNSKTLDIDAVEELLLKL